MTNDARLPTPNRMNLADVLRHGTLGVTVRPLRTVLAALGIAIGIAALVAVSGIPASNQAALRMELEALGPNLLTAAPGETVSGEKAQLPVESIDMVRRIGPVQAVSATGSTSTTARRTEAQPAHQHGGNVLAARLDLLPTLLGSVAHGSFLTEANQHYPVAVLGAVAASRLGIELRADHPAPQVWIGDRYFTVVGVLDPIVLAPLIDRSIMVGWPAASEHLDFDGSPDTMYVRADDHAVEQVRAVLGRTASPAQPREVRVSRPSDALAAARLAEQSYAALFIGLGAVALLVGGVGVANTMVVSVLERRREIGLRRALGASRAQIRGQFVTEAAIISGLGGVAGTILGIAITTGFAAAQGWPTVLPPVAMLGGPAAAILIGTMAGFYPAIRAARLTPTEALAST
jgi:putative ABC transport system permease protein